MAKDSSSNSLSLSRSLKECRRPKRNSVNFELGASLNSFAGTLQSLHLKVRIARRSTVRNSHTGQALYTTSVDWRRTFPESVQKCQLATGPVMSNLSAPNQKVNVRGIRERERSTAHKESMPFCRESAVVLCNWAVTLQMISKSHPPAISPATMKIWVSKDHLPVLVSQD